MVGEYYETPAGLVISLSEVKSDTNIHKQDRNPELITYL